MVTLHVLRALPTVVRLFVSLAAVMRELYGIISILPIFANSSTVATTMTALVCSDTFLPCLSCLNFFDFDDAVRLLLPCGARLRLQHERFNPRNVSRRVQLTHAKLKGVKRNWAMISEGPETQVRRRERREENEILRSLKICVRTYMHSSTRILLYQHEVCSSWCSLFNFILRIIRTACFRRIYLHTAVHTMSCGSIVNAFSSGRSVPVEFFFSRSAISRVGIPSLSLLIPWWRHSYNMAAVAVSSCLSDRSFAACCGS